MSLSLRLMIGAALLLMCISGLEGQLLAGLTLLCFWLGHSTEKKHLQSLSAREAHYQDVSLSSSKALHTAQQVASAELLSASVVVAADAFKNLVATLASLLGGRIEVYALLHERARREALVRLQAEARHRGADQVINVRIETTDISPGSVEAFAYGTAIRQKPPPSV